MKIISGYLFKHERLQQFEPKTRDKTETKQVTQKASLRCLKLDSRERW
jgi:hypothetical protein